MKVIVCLDDKRGMLFNERRQSRDRVLNADVAKMTEGCRLLVAPYSKMLFEDICPTLVCDEGFLDIAEDEDFCFVENRALSIYVDKIEQVVIYWWNRRYPTDLFFDLDLEEYGFKRIFVTEFEGSSHEKITKEIFAR